jgi:hypothetical protein
VQDALWHHRQELQRRQYPGEADKYACRVRRPLPFEQISMFCRTFERDSSPSAVCGPTIRGYTLNANSRTSRQRPSERLHEAMIQNSRWLYRIRTS